METNIDKLRNDIRYESRKFVVQFGVAVALSVGAGVALANYVNGRPPQPAPAPQIIYVPIPAAPAHP